MKDPTIKGHPEIVTESSIPSVVADSLPARLAQALRRQKKEIRITVCAECGALRSILWLDKDRWFCRDCRNTGSDKSKLIPLSRPGRRP